MRRIVSIILAITSLILVAIQLKHRKELQEYKYANEYMQDYINRYIKVKRKTI
ncbi:hypothetical protein FH144_07895 [Staphylococcus caledonicus]|uniref:hypothetical protein n=1 Tax=Staphylococcus TaxID=1279 RepID=UPI001F59F8FA|nr:hypothetical protein [Staphylococcus sp. acrmy]MCI2948347.1 hypothetical protein [Staphylococcus sp. acrmy]